VGSWAWRLVASGDDLVAEQAVEDGGSG